MVAAFRVTALMLLLASNPLLEAQTDTRQEEQLKAWLKKYPEADANKDGVLTLEEAMRYRDSVLKKQREQNRSRQPKRLDELQIPNEFHASFDPRKPEQQQVILDWLEKYLVK